MDQKQTESQKKWRQEETASTSKAGVEEKLAWYTEVVASLPAEARDLLENYSEIPSDERDSRSYACIGQFRFLTPWLSSQPFYPRVLERLRSGASYLDAGCCFGQELRYLLYREGGNIVGDTQLYGFDLEDRFTELGYELFRDRGRLNSTFVSGDVLALPGSAEAGGLDALVGKMDVIFASSFLHVWDWDDMIRAASRLVAFSCARSGSIIVGRQLGSRDAGSHVMPTRTGSNYRHNEESMERFWGEVGERTGIEWNVNSGLYDGEEIKELKQVSWSEPSMMMIWWKAERK